MRRVLAYLLTFALTYGAALTNAQAPGIGVGRGLPPVAAPRPAPAVRMPAVAAAAPLDDGLFLLPFKSQRWPAVTRQGRFGSRRRYGWHDGIDFAVDYRTPVYAAGAGRVIRAEPFKRWRDFGRGYGGLVVVRHADGSQTWYAHLDRVHVRVGQKVTHATRLGLSGGRNNGSSSGPHLHFMVLMKNGRAINPAIAFGRSPRRPKTQPKRTRSVLAEVRLSRAR